MKTGMKVVFSLLVPWQKNNSIEIPVLKKSIAIDKKKGHISYYLNGQQLKIEEELSVLPQQLNDDWPIAAVLAKFHRFRECRGLSKVDESVLNKDAYRDSLNVLRANRCALATKKLKCPACKRLQNRQRRRKERSGCVTEDRTNSSSNQRDRKKIEELMKKLRQQTQLKNRAKLRVQVLKNATFKLQHDLKVVKNTAFENKFNATNICKTQKMVIREMITAAKNNKTGRRYSDNWIILCMLMNVRSPMYYEFLRKNNVLPLPCRKTVRNYFSRSDKEFDFNEKFAELLKKHFSAKNESQRHGLLVFDKMNLCKEESSTSVDSSTLTDAELEDFEANDSKTNDIADQATQGLIIFFQPLADSDTQPIAVFDFKNSVNDDELTQLTLKAIIYAETCGAKIHGIICNGAKMNKRMATLLDIRGTINDTKNWFIHPVDDNRRVFIFSNIPHVIKSIRNRLFNNKRLKVSCLFTNKKKRGIYIAYS